MSEIHLRRCPAAIHAAIDDYAVRRRMATSSVARILLGLPDGLGGGGTEPVLSLARAALPGLASLEREAHSLDWRLTLGQAEHTDVRLLATYGGWSDRRAALLLLAAWTIDDRVAEGVALAALAGGEHGRAVVLAALDRRVEALRLASLAPEIVA